MVQAQFSIHFLQPSVLIFEIFQPFQFGSFHAAVLLSPIVESRFADAMLTSDSYDGLATLLLFKDSHDLGFTESVCSHFSSLL